MKTNILFTTVLVLMLTACSSTKVTSSWKSDAKDKVGYKKIMVLGILNQKDRSLRENLENQLVLSLKDKGINASSALEVYGPKAFNKIKEEDIAAQLQNSGYDAVITTVLLDKSKDKYYQPGTVSYQPVGISRFGRYYSTVYDRVYEPGYYSTSTNYFLESNMYDISSGNLVYSAQSKAVNPASTSTLGKDYGKSIVKDMKKIAVL